MTPIFQKREGTSKVSQRFTTMHQRPTTWALNYFWQAIVTDVFIPIDFSLHHESKTSKLKYGLTAKQRRNQKNTRSCGKEALGTQ